MTIPLRQKQALSPPVRRPWRSPSACKQTCRRRSRWLPRRQLHRWRYRRWRQGSNRGAVPSAPDTCRSSTFPCCGRSRPRTCSSPYAWRCSPRRSCSIHKHEKHTHRVERRGKRLQYQALGSFTQRRCKASARARREGQRLCLKGHGAPHTLQRRQPRYTEPRCCRTSTRRGHHRHHSRPYLAATARTQPRRGRGTRRCERRSLLFFGERD